jgi:hypothetical protein
MIVNTHRITNTNIGSNILISHGYNFLFNIMYIIGIINVYMFASTILVKSMFQSANSTPTKPISSHYLKPLRHI